MRKVIWLLFLLLISGLSYLREILFLSINATISGANAFYAKTAKIDFFLNKSPEFLIQLKYGMTVGFTLAFILLSVLGLKSSFRNKTPYLISLILYGICSLIGGITIIYAVLFDSFQSVYSFLRLVIEYLHNPMIYLFISAAYIGIHFSNKTMQGLKN